MAEPITAGAAGTQSSRKIAASLPGRGTHQSTVPPAVVNCGVCSRYGQMRERLAQLAAHVNRLTRAEEAGAGNALSLMPGLAYAGGIPWCFLAGRRRVWVT